jgi:sugar O-acyltransferase (sialic acid O-acetyltransferase NeuD family)
VVAFAADSPYLCSPTHPQVDLPLVSFEDVERHYPPEDHEIFLSISYPGLSALRVAKVEEAKRKGYRLASFISPRAQVSPHAKIGEHNLIMENNVIQAFVTIGDDNIFWSGNHIGHHTRIGDHNYIASHVVISGNVVIGNRCFFGVNATIRDNISIADENIIGMGAMISRSTKPQEVYYGPRAQLSPKKSGEITI